jgi:hypothetical protein
LFKNWKVLLTPTTSLATSGEYAVVVSPAAPKLINIVTHFGGAQAGPLVVDVLVVHELEAQ